MSGQQQLFDYNQESLLNKYNKSLMNQVDLWYIKDKFAIQTEYDSNKALYSYLLKDMLITHDCELIKFLNKKLRGALGDENIDIVDLRTMQTKYRDINNYYYSSANYEEVQF